MAAARLPSGKIEKSQKLYNGLIDCDEI